MCVTLQWSKVHLLDKVDHIPNFILVLQRTSGLGVSATSILFNNVRKTPEMLTINSHHLKKPN